MRLWILHVVIKTFKKIHVVVMRFNKLFPRNLFGHKTLTNVNFEALKLYTYLCNSSF